MESNNIQLADQAFEECKKYLEQKDYDLARLFCLNALAHNYKKDYIDSLVFIADNVDESVREETIEQVCNILRMSLMQVPASDLLFVKEQLDNLEDKLFDSLPSDSSNSEKTTINEEELKEKILQGEFSWKILETNKKIYDTESISKKIEYIQNVLEIRTLSESTKKIFQDALQESFIYLEFANNKSIIDSKFSEIDYIKSKNTESSYDLLFVSSRLQNISTLINQLSLADYVRINVETNFTDISNQYMNKYNKYEKEYNDLKAKPVFDEIVNLSSGALKPIWENYTNRIKKLENINKTISSKLIELSDSESYLEKAKNVIDKINTEILECSKKRFKNYQEAVANDCVKAIKTIDDNTYLGYDITKKEEVKKLFNECNIEKYDETMLAPETSSLFHYVKQMLLSKLKTNDNAELQKLCVTSNKITLENY